MGARVVGLDSFNDYYDVQLKKVGLAGKKHSCYFASRRCPRIECCEKPFSCSLSQDRASELVRAGVRVYQADLCDLPFLRYLFERYNFSHVVHMAAQAGVRHSLLNPVPYVHANMQCFVTLLDVLKESKVR